MVSQYVKPGGTLVYSTCTITKEENAENADWIEKNLPFEKKEIRDLLPEALKASCEENRIQLLPESIRATDSLSRYSEENNYADIPDSYRKNNRTVVLESGEWKRKT